LARYCNIVLGGGLVATETVDDAGKPVLRIEATTVSSGLATLLAGVLVGAGSASIFWGLAALFLF